MGQCVRAEGVFGQGIPQWTVGGFLGGTQVYLCFPKSTPYQLDHLGKESSLSMEHNLLRERISCVIEVVWNVSGSQQLQPLLTPEKEMAG